MHDIGKVGVDDSVLLKPGKLDADEWKQMKLHPVIGAETLREVDRQHPGNSFIKTGIAIAEGHHEKWDGSGYPQGLKGDDIPVEGRIMAVADVYDALISKRVYKLPFPHSKAVAIIKEEKGIHFDPVVVDAFLNIHEDFRNIALQLVEHDEEREALSS